MKALHKRRCDAVAEWLDVEDLVTDTIDRDARENSRAEGQGALERAQEHATQAANMLGRLINHLACRGMFTAPELDDVIGPAGAIHELKVDRPGEEIDSHGLLTEIGDHCVCGCNDTDRYKGVLFCINCRRILENQDQK